MDFLYLVFYGRLRLRFLDVYTSPGQWRRVPAVCRILCRNVRGLAGNLSDLTVASSPHDILLCSETLVSDMRHVSEVLVPGIMSGQEPLGPWDGCIRLRLLQSISPTQI